MAVKSKPGVRNESRLDQATAVTCPALYAAAARSAARGGHPLWTPPAGLPQRAENQRSEDQRSKARAHHDAKSDAAVDDARAAGVATGTARVLMTVPGGAAPHHAVNIVRSLQLFPAIVRFIWIWEGQFIPC